jgi:Raf kinase inhibitor-like YbhB/YbcL family protein
MSARIVVAFVLGATAALLAGGCGKSTPEPALETDAVFELSSPAFEDGGPIPVTYTCDGEDVSPPLEWKNLPPGSFTLAIVMDDPDAVPVAGHVWDHWIIYDIPVRASSIAEAIPADPELAGGARQGTGSSRVGYQGPCPPPGQTHTYRFRAFAVDARLDLPAGATKEQVLAALEGHVLATGRMSGTYSRQ